MIHRFILAALAGAALGWYLGAVFDGIAAAKEAVTAQEQPKPRPEMPLICQIYKTGGPPACQFPEIGR